MLINDKLKKDVTDSFVVFTGDQIRTAWSNSKLSHLQLISTNKNYRAVPTKIWNQILQLHLSIHEYVADFFDCDSYSAVFVGMVAYDFEINGVVRVFDDSGHHSYNAVLVCDDGKTCEWLKVEPQADIFVNNPPPNVKITAPDGVYDAKIGFAVTA